VDRALVDQLAAGARAVAARDARSAAALGAPVTGDDALLLTIEPPGSTAAPYLVLSLRAADYVGATPAELERWAAEVDAYACERGLTVLGVPFNDQPGAAELDTLLALARTGSARSARWRVADHDPDPRRVAALVAGADAVVTTSYHAALLGLGAGVPAVLGAGSPYYEAKAEGLRELVALPADLVVRPGAPLDLARRLPAVAEGLAGGGVARARARVVAWWDATIGDLLGAEARPAVSG
jgi:hypothetical protein